MCGRYTLRNPNELFERFGLEEMSETRIEPRFNVAPSQVQPVVHARTGHPQLEMMRWGFQPGWMKADGKRPPPINARAETLLERPLFRGSLARQRCLIPADGFYEWQATGGRSKQPMYIHLRDGGMFAFAGLWTWSEELGPTYAIVTTRPNGVMAPIHNRMPALLRREHEELWLDPSVTDPAEVLSLLQPYPDELIEAHPVSLLVNNVRNQGPELVEPTEPMQ